jgi:hypothetical protein
MQLNVLSSPATPIKSSGEDVFVSPPKQAALARTSEIKRAYRKVMFCMLHLYRNGAAGFIAWLDGSRNHYARLLCTIICLQARI